MLMERIVKPMTNAKPIVTTAAVLFAGMTIARAGVEGYSTIPAANSARAAPHNKRLTHRLRQLRSRKIHPVRRHQTGRGLGPASHPGGGGRFAGISSAGNRRRRDDQVCARLGTREDSLRADEVQRPRPGSARGRSLSPYRSRVGCIRLGIRARSFRCCDDGQPEGKDSSAPGPTDPGGASEVDHHRPRRG